MEHVTEELNLDLLPAPPQQQTISHLALRLWADERVVAIWLGGSLARGAGDNYSDIDLRIAVAPSDLSSWEAPAFAALLDDCVVGRQFIRFGADSFLHHLMLANGDILDFLVQSSEAQPVVEPIHMVGCRSAAFAETLASSNHLPSAWHTPASSETVRELLVAFWINSHKHRKVLHRNLDLMFPASAYFNWSLLMRLWYILATGEMTTQQHFSGIHGLTALTEAVEGLEGEAPLALVGMPIRTREEIYAAIEQQRTVAARLGRQLAERYTFEYPEALEAMVLREWSKFVSEHPAGREERLEDDAR